ncbi:MAG: MFS transporter [Desulfatibacillum sp.]|nr:MFS transporter [Desulfatibacillum sp.]
MPENPSFQESPQAGPLFTGSFMLLLLVFFLGLCNMAVFFNFYDCLIRGGVEAKTAGLLLGLFPLTALIVRPFISPFIHPQNALPWIACGTGGMILCLGGYAVASGAAFFGLLRALHGLAFVLMITAVIARTVSVIHPEKSGMAFGIMSIINLLPFAVVPVLVEFGLSRGFSQASVYLSAMVSTAMVFPVLWLIGKSPSNVLHDEGKAKAVLSRREIMGSFRNPAILLALSLAAVSYFCFSIVFFFLKSYGPTIGIERVGPFFVFSTFAMISVRLAASSLFDRWNKAWMCAGALVFVGLMFVLLESVRSPWSFYVSGGLLGLGWGIAMPVVMAIVFNMSAPRLRAFNTNMLIEMVDLGYFLGPVLGGLIIARYGYPVLFFFMSAVSIIFGLLALRLAGKV